jgi:hypothetical protein
MPIPTENLHDGFPGGYVLQRPAPEGADQPFYYLQIKNHQNIWQPDPDCALTFSDLADAEQAAPGYPGATVASLFS